jgi:hypothetical protein
MTALDPSLRSLFRGGAGASPVRLATSHLVFLAWSYPLWRRVFVTKHKTKNETKNETKAETKNETKDATKDVRTKIRESMRA